MSEQENPKELKVTITFEEYSRLVAIAQNVKELCDNNAKLIQAHYQRRIDYLERLVYPEKRDE